MSPQPSLFSLFIVLVSLVVLCKSQAATMGTVSYAAASGGAITVSWSGANLGSGSGQIIYSQCLTGGVTTLMNVNPCPGTTSSCFSSGAGSKTIDGLISGTVYTCRAHIVSGGSSVANHGGGTVTTTSGIPPQPTGSKGTIIAGGITITVACSSAGTESGNTQFNFTATFTPSSGTAEIVVNQMASYTSGASTSWSITGITPGTYTLTVTATNNFGTSSALSLGSVTIPAPATMGTVNYAAASGGGITVSWSGANLGPGSGQVIYSQCLTGGVTTLMNVNSCPGTTSSCFSSGAGSKTISGLISGTVYTCRAHIVSGGSSVANDGGGTVTTTSGIPPQPTGSTGSTVTGGITVTVACSSAGTESGNTQFNFTAIFTPSSGSAETATNQMASYTSGASIDWDITGITPGTYTLTITATNNFGTSSALSLGSVTIPAQNLGTVTASHSGGNIVVRWTGASVHSSATSPTFYSECTTEEDDDLEYTNPCPATTGSCLTSGAGSYTIGPVYTDTTYYCRAALNSSNGANHDVSNDVEVNTTTGIPMAPTGSANADSGEVTLTLSCSAAGTTSGNTSLTFRATFTPSSGTAITESNAIASYTSGNSVTWTIAIADGTYDVSVNAINEFGTSLATSLGSVTVTGSSIASTATGTTSTASDATATGTVAPTATGTAATGTDATATGTVAPTATGTAATGTDATATGTDATATGTVAPTATGTAATGTAATGTAATGTAATGTAATATGTALPTALPTVLPSVLPTGSAVSAADTSTMSSMAQLLLLLVALLEVILPLLAVVV
ncbi:PREDICTED: mucin-19-like isoform X2 [Amphimedon queenslandica]|uniref:Fibronectin type-III domain-containing protein n=1 Tax=Amphimedon queenslandica TaxID=400682 RepID=A0AAN0IZV3_AMPQE|nr:PREDICTED: mucin-19-like isoform X2 [Amphimedon queenslandica]|eukprot:XP_019850072.1 PREDICTED: mucin-19-like isoform X2 [Amphimedon queenslandica]